MGELTMLTSEAKRAPWPEPLQLLAEALVRAVSLADVAAAAVSYGTAAAGARCAHIMLFDHEDQVGTSLLGGSAVPSRRLEHIAELRAPWSDAVEGGSTLVFRSSEDLYQVYPELDKLGGLPSKGAVITLPLTSAHHTAGALTFGFGRRGRISAATEATIADVASLVAQAARRAVLYEVEHHSAEMLQRAYLPNRLADIGGLSFASRYLPASGLFAVGGDWYDAIPLPGDRVGLIIGDVAGHGIRAATIMASLRGALRAFSTIEVSPGDILTRLNTYTCMFKPDTFATALVAIFDPGQGAIQYASAGHPPALLLGEDGSVDVLTEPLGPPLGLPGTTYRAGERPFPPGSMFAVYTDGLIERRDQAIDVALEDLARSAAAGAGTADDLCDQLVFELLAGVDLFDDAALLIAVRDGGNRFSGRTR